MSKIDDLYTKAAAAFQRGDAAQWEAAEIMAELTELGETQRQIADRLGCSKNTVGRYLAVMRVPHGDKQRPAFSDVMATVRSDTTVSVPRGIDARAALAAELLKDKAVFETPTVKKEMERQYDREMRQAAAEWNREAGRPTQTQQTHDRRRRSVVVNRIFWRDFLFELQKMNRMLNDAVSELDRTGLPDGPGDIIKASRLVAKNAERFNAAASEHAVGTPMS